MVLLLQFHRYEESGSCYPFPRAISEAEARDLDNPSPNLLFIIAIVLTLGQAEVYIS